VHRIATRLAIPAIFCIPLIVLVPYVGEFLRVNKCLDIGGSWDYTLGQCDLAISHSVVAFCPRHVRLFQVAAVLEGTAFVVLCAIATRSTFRKSRTYAD
jgi:hypothetical protein